MDSSTPPMPKCKKPRVAKSKSPKADEWLSATSFQDIPFSSSTSWPVNGGVFVPPVTGPASSSSYTSSVSDTNGKVTVKITKAKKVARPSKTKKKIAGPSSQPANQSTMMDQVMDSVIKGNNTSSTTSLMYPRLSSTVSATATASRPSVAPSSKVTPGPSLLPPANYHHSNQTWNSYSSNAPNNNYTYPPVPGQPWMTFPTNHQSSPMWSPTATAVSTYTPGAPLSAGPSPAPPPSWPSYSTSSNSIDPNGLLNSYLLSQRQTLSMPPRASLNNLQAYVNKPATWTACMGISHNSTPNIITSPPPPVLATPAMPPDWMKCYDNASLSLNPFQKFPLDATSLEYTTIVELLAPTQVISAEKVVNPDLWQRYRNTRKDMIRAKTADLSLLPKLGLDDREVMHCTHHALNYDRDPLLETDAGKYSPNEVLLFHCTRNQQNLDKILLQGLDERLSSVTGGLLGKGIYFADDPEKSLQYDGGAGVILIFAVLLGDCLCVDHVPNKAKFVREPEKEKTQKRNFNDQFFDSITSRPGQHNEYVIYNRNQCCPLYMVKYQRSYANSGSYPGDNYSKSRTATPPFAWKKLPGPKPPLPNQASDGSWPFYAVSVFGKMGVLPVPDKVVPPIMDGVSTFDITDPVPDTSTKDKLESLQNLGFLDDAKNIAALKKYHNNLDDAANFLLDSEAEIQLLSSRPRPTTSSASSIKNKIGKPSSGPVTTIDLTSDSSSPKPATDSNNDGDATQTQTKIKLETDDLPEELANWVMELVKTPPPPSVPTLPSPVLQQELEECSICCNEYDPFTTAPWHWKELECSHKLCVSCFQSIETSGTTMAGVRHTSIRCPFCQGITGIEVGTCPNGSMTVTRNPAFCEGYPYSGSIQISYNVNSGKYSLSRVAYLPDNQEGNEVLKLLQTAWDRKLCFTIGNSITTGAQNVLVWNIHHKSALRGGVHAHGYPDPSYLERVKWELKAYGIE